jgi:predicted N-acetyltransferase YhbS
LIVAQVDAAVPHVQHEAAAEPMMTIARHSRLRSVAVSLKRPRPRLPPGLRGKSVAGLVAIDTVAAADVDALLDRAFGPDRHQRTAYRLREGTTALHDLSFALVEGTTLLGSIQCWPVHFVGDDGLAVPLVLVGPVAVAPERQQAGLGRLLTAATLAAADSRRLDLMLIGDPEYYGRFFGFSAEATAGWRLPGPVERHRLLARGAGIPSGTGTIAPRTGPTR